MVKIKVKTIWQGKVGIRDKYIFQAQEKKEKIEKFLEEKIWDRNYYAKKVGKELICDFDANKANLEDVDLEIEALQDFIDRIDSELRKEANQ